MRIAAVISHPIQYYAPFFRQLAEHVDLHVFYGQSVSPAQQAEAGFNVAFDWDVELLSGYEHSFIKNVSLAPNVARFNGCDTPEIGRLLREGKFDALLVVGWYLKCLVQATVAGKRLGLPVLVRGDSHLGMPRSTVKRLLKLCTFPIALRLFDAALYVGEKSRVYYRHFSYPEERLFFSPHCIDAGWFAAQATRKARAALRARLDIANDAKVALFAGKLIPFKRPLDLVAAAAQSKSQGRRIDVLVAGAGPLQSELMETAKQAGVSCHMLGFCNQSEMPAVYAAADVLALPSDGRETWGLVANEALACGRPIVLSDAVGAAPDLAADGTAGRMFRSGDIDALTAALADVIDNPPRASAIAAKSSAYSLTAAVDGMMSAIDYVSPGRRAAMQ